MLTNKEEQIVDEEYRKGIKWLREADTPVPLGVIKPTFKMSDKVIFKGEEWEVGFINQTHFKGTLRLQKSGLVDAKQINYIYPEDVTKIQPTIPKKERR